MFELFLERPKQESSSSSKGDRITEIATVLGKILKFLFAEPYKGVKYRFKYNPKFSKYLAILQLVTLPLYVWLGDEAVLRFIIIHSLDKILPEWVLDSRFFLFLGFVAHTYLLVTRLPQMRKENLCNQKLKKLGLVSSSNKDEEIRLITETPLDNDQRRLILSNPGIPKSSYEAKKEAIEARFNCIVCDIDYGASKNVIHIDFREKDFPKLISYDEFYKNFEPRPFEFGVGTVLNGKKIFTTLEEMVHLLVAGETSGGKSTFLRQMLVQLLSQKNPLKVYFVDLKSGVEADPFSNDPRVQVFSETTHILTMLEKLIELYELRMALFKKESVANVRSYEEKKKNKLLTRHLLIIDECAEIFLPSIENREERIRLTNIRSSLSRLARLARSAGIHIVLCTQRPSKEAIDMQSKDNMVSRLCFRVNNSYVSQMVLDDGRATQIEKDAKGRAIWKANDELEVQVPFIGEGDTKVRVENLKGKVTVPAEEVPQKKSKMSKIRKKENQLNEETPQQ